MTVRKSKPEAAMVYEQCLRDAEQECRRLFGKIKKDDERHADRLRTQLKRLLVGVS